MAERLGEALRTEARVLTGGEALIVHLDAEITRVRVRDHLPRVPARTGVDLVGYSGLLIEGRGSGWLS